MKPVDGHRHRNAEFLHILYMGFQVDDTLFEGLHIFTGKLGFGDASIIL